MSKWKKQDLLVLHNNLARRKGVAELRDGTMMEICDAIERVNAMPDYVPQRDKPAKVQVKTLRDRWRRFHQIINQPIRLSS